jgi:transcriptional regulator with PAS, ATPase and Fis domain
MDLRILDSITEGVIFVTKDRKIGYINKVAQKIVNRKVGDDCYGLFSICATDCPLRDLEKNPHQVDLFDVKLSCCDKAVCHSITPVYDKGEFIGLLEEFKDSSKLVNYIKELKKQKEFTEVILDSIVDAIVVIDNQGEIIHYNEVARQILCREISDIKGFNIENLLGIPLSKLPPEGEREDIHIETPAIGQTKVSLMVSSLKEGEGKVISFYILPECMISQEVKGRIITKNPHFSSVLEMAKTVADTTATILIEGETGTGKSILAKYIHTLSSRRDKPFIKINCAAIPENLLESELFGYVKGAFTGANKDKPGKVELAEGGTLFLDEIGDLPIYLQSKLLHLLQEKEFERLGDIKTRKANIRIIAATNKNLQELIEKGEFREDLYYRLKVISLKVPPLRERKEDIPSLVNYFVDKYSEIYKRQIKGISPEAMKLLLNYDFPGNIRELENMVERAVIVCTGKYISKQDLPEEIRCNHRKETKETIIDKSRNREISVEEIVRILKETKGNKSLAAKILGIHRTTLWRKIKEYQIEM